MGPGSVLRIGDELIWYARAANGRPVTALSHAGAGTSAPSPPPTAGAKKRWPRAPGRYGTSCTTWTPAFLPEIAGNFAKGCQRLHVDMLYFDGSERLQGDHWVLQRPAAQDHLGQAGQQEHADAGQQLQPLTRGHLAGADRLGRRARRYQGLPRRAVQLVRLLRPRRHALDIGLYYGYDPTATPDCSSTCWGIHHRLRRFDVVPGLAGQPPPATRSRARSSMISRYEKLRLSGRVSPEMRGRLRIDPALGGQLQPAERQARLDKRRGSTGCSAPARTSRSNASFTAIGTRPPASTARTTPGTCAWRGRHAAARAASHVTHGGLAEGRSFLRVTASPRARELRGPRRIRPGRARTTLAGVTQDARGRRGRRSRGGLASRRTTATSSRPAPDGWSYAGRRFDPPLDISWHKASASGCAGTARAGVQGANSATARLRQNYYVQNRFTGWRYQHWPGPRRTRSTTAAELPGPLLQRPARPDHGDVRHRRHQGVARAGPQGHCRSVGGTRRPALGLERPARSRRASFCSSGRASRSAATACRSHSPRLHRNRPRRSFPPPAIMRRGSDAAAT